jgi:hypothetical protein
MYMNTVWHVDLQTSMFPWQQLHSSRETVLSMQSMPRCYKQDKLGDAVGWWVSELVGELLLLLEAGS